MDKIREKDYYTKNELINTIANINDVSIETVKSFVNRKCSLSNYKDDKGNYRVPVNVVTALNIIFRTCNHQSWEDYRKCLKKENMDNILKIYDAVFDEIKTDELEESDRIAIEMILDAYTRKTQIEYLQRINAIKEIITYEINELSYPSTVSICKHVMDMNSEILLSILLYKDKYPNEVFKEANENYILPKEQEKLKQELLETLKYITNDIKECIEQDVKLIEEIIKQG